MLDILKTAARRVASDALIPSLSEKRWTVLRTDQGLYVFGYVFGRRTADKIGVVIMLKLEPDGTLMPLLVPVNAIPPVVPEEQARIGFVHAHKRGYVPRGHVFEPSPVYPSLCAICAENAEFHERDQKIALVQQVLQTLDVDVTFRDGSSEIADIKVRNAPIQQPRLNPMPGEKPPEPGANDPPRATWRSLDASEHAMVVRMVGELAVATGLAQSATAQTAQSTTAQSTTTATSATAP